MSFGDFIFLVAVLAGILGLAGIMNNSYRRRLEHKERIAELRASGGQSGVSQEHIEVIERLEHRIRVLERIATDKSANLAAQIEDLRESAN